MVVGLSLAMFKEIINSNFGSYTISDSYEDLRKLNHENCVILYDEKIEIPEALNHIMKRISVDGNESLKTIESAQELILEFSRLGLNRNSHLIAIGGGSVQDICTFVCSIYMRGISWTYVPSTLMAMADSCIGGKSSINVGQIKNLVGNFYPPQNIILDFSLIQTLNRSAIACGLFEGVKICHVKSVETSKLFMNYSEGWLFNDDANALNSLVALSLTTKKWFIEVDEFDVAERKLLNYGHSFGHALESATQMNIPHGIAIGLGMLAAMEYSGNKDLGLIEFIYKILKWAECDFSTVVFDADRMKEALKKDKKNSHLIQRLVLPDINQRISLKELEMSDFELDKQVKCVENLLRGIN